MRRSRGRLTLGVHKIPFLEFFPMVVATARFYTRGVRAVHKTEHLSAAFGSITPGTLVVPRNVGSKSRHSLVDSRVGLPQQLHTAALPT